MNSLLDMFTVTESTEVVNMSVHMLLDFFYIIFSFSHVNIFGMAIMGRINDFIDNHENIPKIAKYTYISNFSI